LLIARVSPKVVAVKGTPLLYCQNDTKAGSQKRTSVAYGRPGTDDEVMVVSKRHMPRVEKRSRIAQRHDHIADVLRVPRSQIMSVPITDI